MLDDMIDLQTGMQELGNVKLSVIYTEAAAALEKCEDAGGRGGAGFMGSVGVVYGRPVPASRPAMTRVRGRNMHDVTRSANAYRAFQVP